MIEVTVDNPAYTEQPSTPAVQDAAVHNVISVGGLIIIIVVVILLMRRRG